MKRGLVAVLLAVAACSALFQWSSCGSSGSTPTPPEPTAPTISTVTVTGGNAVSSPTAGTIDTTGTTNVSTATTSFTATFSTAMAPTTVDATNITLACPSGTAQPLGTITANTDNTAFTISTSAALPAITICELTFGTGITNSDGTALTAATYTFTTGCTTNDNFGTDTVTGTPACWTKTSASGSDETFSVSSGALDLTTSTQVTLANPNDIFSVSKTFANSIFASTSDITFMVTVTNLSAAPPESEDSANTCTFGLIDSNTDTIMTNTAAISLARRHDVGYEVRYAGVGDLIDSATSTLCIVLNSNIATYGTSADGTTCTPLPGNNTTTFLAPTGSAVVGLDALNGLGGSLLCQYDDFTVTGASATEQD